MLMKYILAILIALVTGDGLRAQSLQIYYPTPLTIVSGVPAPFAGISVSDTYLGATTDIVTIIVSGSGGGTLSGPGLTGSNPYTLTTTPSAITGALQALLYTPSNLANATANFDITITSSQIITLGNGTGSIELDNLNLTDETSYPVPPGTFTPRNFKGVNIAGAENAYPASSGGCSPNCSYNYIYPAVSELDYWSSKSMGLIRLPLQIRRLQPTSYGPLDPIGRTDEPAVAGSTPGTQTNLIAIKAVLDRALTDGLYVIIEPHNFGYIRDTNTGTDRLIGADAEGTAQFVDWWIRVSTKFKNYPNVIFGLMNEQHDQTASQWKTGAVAAINSIAQVTTARWVFIPGTSWTGGHSWVSSGSGAAWAAYVPPAGMQIAFDMHEYLDSDFSGTHAVCAGFGSSPMTGAVSWAQTNGFKIHIGEIGWSQDASCPADATALMSYFSASQPTVIGWAYWVGGSQAFYGGYFQTVQPTGYPAGPFTDKPQTSILTGNLN
jgi:endoglucanase